MIETIAWRKSLEEARIEARERNKDLLVDLYNPDSGGCRFMETRTYTDPKVSQFVNEFMMPVQFNVKEDPGTQRRYRCYWAPCAMLFDVDGGEFRRAYGAMDAGRFLAEFWLGLGLRYLHTGHPHKAVNILDEALQYTSASPEAHAENYFWLGCARFNATGNADELEEEWRNLRMEYPESEWTRKGDFLFAMTDGTRL